MNFLKQLSIVFLFSLLAVAAEPVATPSAAPVLPTEFAGWQTKGDITREHDPGRCRCHECAGFERVWLPPSEKASYTRDDGRNLTIKAAVFDDASGAYGAFTYYHSDDMGEEQIGGQAAFQNNRVLFYQGNVLVDAMFDQDERDVRSATACSWPGFLPQAEGNKSNPPSLPSAICPSVILRRTQTKYILGPVTLDRIGSPLAGSTVDFKSGAEVVIGKYAVNCRRCDADAHRISHAADRRGSATTDRCLPSSYATATGSRRRFSMSGRSSIRAPVRSS